jgi:hypothetical protein
VQTPLPTDRQMPLSQPAIQELPVSLVIWHAPMRQESAPAQSALLAQVAPCISPASAVPPSAVPPAPAGPESVSIDASALTEVRAFSGPPNLQADKQVSEAAHAIATDLRAPHAFAIAPISPSRAQRPETGVAGLNVQPALSPRYPISSLPHLPSLLDGRYDVLREQLVRSALGGARGQCQSVGRYAPVRAPLHRSVPAVDADISRAGCLGHSRKRRAEWPVVAPWRSPGVAVALALTACTSPPTYHPGIPDVQKSSLVLQPPKTPAGRGEMYARLTLVDDKGKSVAGASVTMVSSDSGTSSEVHWHRRPRNWGSRRRLEEMARSARVRASAICGAVALVGAGFSVLGGECATWERSSQARQTA